MLYHVGRSVVLTLRSQSSAQFLNAEFNAAFVFLQERGKENNLFHSSGNLTHNHRG